MEQEAMLLLDAIDGLQIAIQEEMPKWRTPMLSPRIDEMRIGNQRLEDEPHIDLVPLIDVILVLIIFS